MDRYMFQRPEKHRIHHEHKKHHNKTELWFDGKCCLTAMKTQMSIIVVVALASKKS